MAYKYPQIEIATTDPESLRKAVSSLKEVVETIIGLRNEEGRLNTVFVQTTTPTANRVGDIWIKQAVKPGDVQKVSYWSGTKWIVLV